MPVYVIGQLRVTNWKWYSEYKRVVEPLVARHGGTYLIKGGEAACLEGMQGIPDAVVVLQFPTREQALQWFEDPEYAPMIELRQGGARTEMLLVDGI